MANLNDKVRVDIENINQSLEELPDYKKLPRLSKLELAGIATHNYYNGIENILKQILKYKDVSIPSGSSWHKDILNLPEENNIISSQTKQDLIENLAFNHSYKLDLYPTKMEPVVENIYEHYSNFKSDLSHKVQNINI